AQYAKLIWYLPKTAKTLGSALIPEKDASGRRRFSWPKNLSLGPRTLFNVSITNQRTFGSVSIPLDEAKQIAKAVNVTINDVVLGLCSGAMRRYLEESGYDGVPKKPMVAAVPVSLREAGNTEQNTQATMMLCSLASHIKDPIERLKAIKSSTSAAKESINNFKAVIPTDFPSFGAPWLMSGLASLYGRSKIADNLPPIANVAISNVPGPPVPLYLAGARMRTYYPVSIIMHGMALNITVESYQGSLDFGLTACRRAIPDVKDLANYIADAHQELKTKVTAYLAEIAAKEEARALAPATDEPEDVTPDRPRRGRRPKAVNIEITTPRTVPIEVEEVKVEAKPRRGRRPKAIPAEVIATEAQPASVTSIRTRRQRRTS
ncbi:MAG TPA: WS/DGAT domain-containing protein, partial [Acidobacteriota bacterium]|nr:WS/DGAT domain-containing protein [Acidobacteriota bacterium]